MLQKYVVSLSDKTLDEFKLAVLHKGLNFVPIPRAIPAKETIAGIEEVLRTVSAEVAISKNKPTKLTLH